MNLKEKLKSLPLKPGCYLMKDKNNTIIYVGKAINLKNRLNSYFIGAHDYKTTKLVSEIIDFEYIITKNEKEALILEYNLIKEYNPKFNIKFMDDRSYPYILLSSSLEPYCSVVRLNKKNKPKGKLFGPFPDVKAARNYVALINKLFKTRKCKNYKKDACLYYHLNQCLGYCIKDIEIEEIENEKQKIIDFIKGDNKKIIKEYDSLMNDAVEKLDYEKAILYRDLIEDIKNISSKQDVQHNNKDSFDIFNYYVEDGYISITGLFIKNGRLLNSDRYIDYLVGDVENFVSSYIYNFYQLNVEPKKLIVNKELLIYLKEAFNFEVISVNRGYKYALLKQAKENSIEYLKQNKNEIINKDNYLDNIKEEFKRIFNFDIKRIEVFDNSHTSFKNTVASMVVYEDFKPNKKEYRLYKLEDDSDDLKSMQEVLYRRYFRVIKDNLKRPDLIIVDGAKNQIKIAKTVLKSLNLDIRIVGLGKDNHHNTSFMLDENYNLIDIKKDSNIFFFLTNIQDEVHRFAINYHKKLRRKNTYKSILDDIEGLGPKSRIKLLKKYKSIENIKKLSIEELMSVLNKKTATTLYNKIRVNDNEEFK